MVPPSSANSNAAEPGMVNPEKLDAQVAAEPVDVLAYPLLPEVGLV